MKSLHDDDISGGLGGWLVSVCAAVMESRKYPNMSVRQIAFHQAALAACLYTYNTEKNKDVGINYYHNMALLCGCSSAYCTGALAAMSLRKGRGIVMAGLGLSVISATLIPSFIKNTIEKVKEPP